MAKLRLVQLGDAPGQVGAARQQMHLDAPAIATARATLHQAQLLAAIHQRHGAVVLGLEPLGQLADRRPLAPLEAQQVQQQLVLQRRQAVVAADVLALAQEDIDYHDAYLLAALAPLPLWSSSIVLLIPSLALNALAVLVALGISCSLVYHGLQALCARSDNDVTTMSATYTIMAAGVLAWGLLMAIVWAY